MGLLGGTNAVNGRFYMKYKVTMKESFREFSFIFETAEEVVGFIKVSAEHYVQGKDGNALEFLVEPLEGEDAEI